MFKPAIIKYLLSPDYVIKIKITRCGDDNIFVNVQSFRTV